MEIVSGDAAVVINNDQIGHKIEVALDSSKLPASSVSSVNGQTGAVRLDAADIPSDGNSNVQADITTNKAAINECFDSITSEQAARQNADATLQTNINAARASIPEMSTTPDPYKGVERDAQGRAFAADPESGATDKTLVTANWASQTGDSAPNNLLHKNGNETATGNKYIYTLYSVGMLSLTGNQYNSIMELGATGTGGNIVFSISGRYGFAIGGIAYDGNGNPTFKGASYFTAGNRTTLGVGIKDGMMYLCGRRTASQGQSPVIQIFSHTRGTGAPTVEPGVTNPVVEMDSYIEAFQF